VSINVIRHPFRLQCGWCGAINDQTQRDVFDTSLLRARRRTCLKHLQTTFRWLIVGIVFLIIASVLTLGVTCLLPRVCWSYTSWVFHVSWVAALTFNVLFNYAACMWGSPGTVRSCVAPAAPAGAQVPQQAYKDYTYCSACKYLKPPRVHHCRICRTCVVDMDHHCPFINNCVGRANLRSFILFLFWTLVSATYVVILSSTVLIGNYKFLVDTSVSASLHNQAYYDYWFSLIIILDTCPWWLLGSMYLFLCGMALTFGVGFLFFSQMRYIFLGVSYITSLKGPAPTQPASGVKNFSQVLGSSNPLMWLMPMWGPPAGVLLTSSTKKHH
jgi:hypothetical protein